MFFEIGACLYLPYRDCLFKYLLSGRENGVTFSHVRITCVSRDMVVSEYLRARLFAMFNVSATKISCRMDLQYNYESRNNINMT